MLWLKREKKEEVFVYMKYVQPWLTVTVVLCCMIGVIALTSKAYAFETPLRTEKADAPALKGSFSVILYGSRFSDDLETFAILDPEGDSYHFVPYAPEYDYRVRKGLEPEEARALAEKFVSFHRAFWRMQMHRILDREGSVIGYELRPLYLLSAYGTHDVMDISYWVKEGGRVKVIVSLIPAVERRTPFGGESEHPGTD